MKSATLAYFALGSCHKKVLCKAFTRNILGTVRDKLKVYIKSLSLRILSQWSSSWSTSPTFKYISQESNRFKFTYFYIEPEYIY